MKRNVIFHVWLGKQGKPRQKRTTISLDNILSALWALKLGHTPETSEAHAAVRECLQAKLDEDLYGGRTNVSQWIAGEMLLGLVDKRLSKEFRDWFLKTKS